MPTQQSTSQGVYTVCAPLHEPSLFVWSKDGFLTSLSIWLPSNTNLVPLCYALLTHYTPRHIAAVIFVIRIPYVPLLLKTHFYLYFSCSTGCCGCEFRNPASSSGDHAFDSRSSCSSPQSFHILYPFRQSFPYLGLHNSASFHFIFQLIIHNHRHIRSL